MSRNYKFYNPDGIYFVSFAVVEWVDVFTRRMYKDILVDSLNFCIKEKGMVIYAWCIMTNHMHLVFSSTQSNPAHLLGDFKRFTSNKLVKAILNNPQESRKEWLIQTFKIAASNSSNVKHHQFWRHDNKPIELWSNEVIDKKINYIHQNPIVEGIVHQAGDYIYSSAKNYEGGKGLVNNVQVL
jgi:REP element-mobilizing transposase RayT